MPPSLCRDPCIPISALTGALKQWYSHAGVLAQNRAGCVIQSTASSAARIDDAVAGACELCTASPPNALTTPFSMPVPRVCSCHVIVRIPGAAPELSDLRRQQVLPLRIRVPRLFPTYNYMYLSGMATPCHVCRHVLHGESITDQASPRTPTQRTFQPQEAVQPM